MLAFISVEVPADSCVAASAGSMSCLAELAVGYSTDYDQSSASVRTEVVRDRWR